VDVFTWFSHLKPKFVIGMGSQLRRITGDIYDNFSVDIEYEGGVHVHAMARQIDNCHNRIAEIIQGTKGSWSSQGFVIRDLDGKEVWKYDEEAAKEQFEQHNAYVLEHIDLVNHIRGGKVVNHAETTAIASMACIMARESAYTGKAFTWDEMTQSDLNLMPAELHLGNVDMSKYAPPRPGTSPKM
jgi:predicted dehydrogenase